MTRVGHDRDSYFMPYEKFDELSFGEEREPWLQTWVTAHRWMLSIAVATAVVLAGLGTGGWYLHRQSLLPSPPPDVALPPAVSFVVELCLKKNSNCTTGTIEQAAEFVRGIPEVASSVVVTHEERLARFSETSLTGEDLLKNGDGLWPAEIEGELRHTEDFEVVKRQLTGEPGVATVSRYSRNFWKGRADLQVNLCGLSRLSPACRNGAGTETQRNAVVARLREQSGVNKVFLEDPAFGLRLSRHYQPEYYLTINDVPERLYVRLDDPAKARAAGQAVLAMPGVESASLIK
ncbi:permease-like cell division protein FtsX [Streptosporangium sp. 'caverna']|uniref:permease-like cell division protein FtsX n=1 Tax=Streptosporangium sp. 'caverna' TaxID=2202249 RepID=UPI0013A70814|nr:permease-like cell division protein FtsX [Streptosporangium sp. 'caverna']